MLAKFIPPFDRFFFAPTDGRSLVLFRLLYCGVLACVHLREMSRVESLYGNPLSVYFPIPLFEWLGLGQLPLHGLRLCGALLLLGLLAAACGWLTRLALTVSWITFFFFYGSVLGFEKPEPNSISFYTYHYNNIVIFVLLILSVAPGISLWSVNAFRKHGWTKTSLFWFEAPPAIPAWPLLLIKLTLALAYFGASYTKLITSGFLWADGYTLQAYFLIKHLQEGAPAGYWLAQYYWACVAASVGTLILELSFIVVPFLRPRSLLLRLYIVAGLGFHLMIAVTMNILHFLPFMCLTYFIFLDWPTVCDWARFFLARFSQLERRLQPSTTDAALIPVREKGLFADTPLARLFIVGTLSVSLLSIGLNIELWPFTDYGVFRGRLHYSQVRVGQVRGIDKNSNTHWLHAPDFGPGFNGWYDGGNFLRFYMAYSPFFNNSAARINILIDGTLLRFLLPHSSHLLPRDTEEWRQNLQHEGPELLREFHDHLPLLTRERFPTLEFVIRSVRMDAEGWFAPFDTVAFSTTIQGEL
jgi:hypothetical protein